MVSCSVAQAKLFVKAGVYMIKKAHRRWAINTGDMIPRLLNFRVHRPLNTLRRQLPCGLAVAGQVENHRTQNRGKRRAGESHEPMPACSHANPLGSPAPLPSTPAHRQSSSGSAEAPGPKGGRQVGLDIQVQLLESIHSQSTPDTRAAQEQR